MTDKSRDLMMRQDGSMSRLFNFDRLHDMVDSLEKRFWDGFGDFGKWHARVFEEIQPKMTLPKVNVIDEPEAYRIEIAMAGFGREDLELELKDNCLFIKLEHREEGVESSPEYLLKEISSRSFRRVLRFPLEVDASEASCTYKDGIATCSVGKVLEEPDKARPVKIEVK